MLEDEEDPVSLSNTWVLYASSFPSFRNIYNVVDRTVSCINRFRVFDLNVRACLRVLV